MKIRCLRSALSLAQCMLCMHTTACLLGLSCKACTACVQMWICPALGGAKHAQHAFAVAALSVLWQAYADQPLTTACPTMQSMHRIHISLNVCFLLYCCHCRCNCCCCHASRTALIVAICKGHTFLHATQCKSGQNPSQQVC